MLNIDNNDTITAIATPPGVGAIAVIRISGPLSFNIIDIIFQPKIKNIKSRRIYLGYIYSKNTLLDKVLINIFKSPNSYTGEDIIEISCHGSIYIQNKILDLIINNGARLATRGEFTFRAFKNGKLDLYQVESLLELFDSENELDHNLALNNLRGEVSRIIKTLRKKILNLNTIIEFWIDFSEEDIKKKNILDFKKLLVNIRNHIKDLITSFKLGLVFKKGIAIAIIGKPNVGKSTLFNVLLKYDRSIVSNKSGTTINYIEENIYIDGIKYRLIDNAGIKKNTLNKLELKGIKKTLENIKKSEIIMYLTNKINPKYRHIQRYYKDLFKKEIIFIINKCDLLKTKLKRQDSPILISAKYGIGIKDLLNKLKSISERFRKNNNKTIIPNRRHYEELKKALFKLNQIKDNIKIGIEPEILSLILKEANYSLEKIIGTITNEEILFHIFDRFCIGK
ncbi:tRNA uridine-5-carboxymethylaminomethyl(34) synthesis GTPase MnmE [Candidatus Karelsulcia muelleri]|uniref:tRNA uridine-5-carboxymethylaminomethyl(34) synthesis GTPase MnmE n=1 Tax=Candidatus Karelsulcia muelleri TaxID=336810 RepID=UPI0019523285|nr:tRNA uridine-5-carboxymethylaminomethyl(34) synthesis GTPase MnmE [Candidatus Karelsulcia muelleri]